MANEPIIQLKNVSKDFFVKIQEIKVLRGISVDIQPGELVVILGPSGSGKSTLLNLILGLEPPTTGEVIFKGEPIHDKDPDYLAEIRKQSVGMVHQQANWIRSLSVIENVAFPLTLRNLPRHQVLNAAREKLALFGMDGWANFNPSELSSGQQQKIGLARALVTEPDVIVADEPTGNLDFKSGRYLVGLLADLVKNGKTVIMVTHDLEYIEFADRIIRILDGKVFEEINNKKDKETIAKLKKKIVSENIEAEKFYTATEDNAPHQNALKTTIKGKISKFFKKIRPKSFKYYLNSFKTMFVDFVDVIMTMIIVTVSLIYRLFNRFLGIKYWPNFVHNLQHKLSNFYYRVSKKFNLRKDMSVNYADLIDLSLKNLLSKKTRTYVTVGGVALGIAFTVFLVSIGFGLEKLVLENFSKLDQLRALDVYSSVGQNLQITDQTLEDLQNLGDVEEVYPVTAIAGKVTLQGSDTDIVAYGVERNYLEKSDLNLLNGEYFSNEGIAIETGVGGLDDDVIAQAEPTIEESGLVVTEDGRTLEEIDEENENLKKVKIEQTGLQQAIVNDAFLETFALDTDSAINETFDVTLIATQEVSNQDIDLESYPVNYQISGVIDNYDIPVIYIPLKDVQTLGVQTYSQARVMTAGQDFVYGVREKVDVLGYRTETVLDTIVQIEETFRNIRMVLTSIGMVALAVASFGMFNTLTVSLLERTREVGLLKVMGMKSFEIKDLFLTESILLGLGGGIVGVVLGILAGTFVSTSISSVAISRGYDSLSVASVPWTMVLAILGVAVVTGVLTGLYPSKRATNISALDALRYE